MGARMKQKGAKLEKIKSKVLPINSHFLKEAVVPIGYSVSGLKGATALKISYEEMKERLGGKGAGLASMVKLGIPVPPAFNLATSLCGTYLKRQSLPEVVVKNIELAMSGMEKTLKRRFGSAENPLLVSVRSGARVSMPGMMDTILNLGLTTEITQALATKYPERARFWWDCYRRLIQMFSDVVLEVDHDEFESILNSWKARENVRSDAELSVEALANICESYLERVRSVGKTFPQNPWNQLLLAIEAVFRSWNTERAIHYRKLNHIPEDWGTSVTVQAMVFGNMNERSGTGVVFTRDPSTGEKVLYGEYLMNAQGEDVVAGIRTPEHMDHLKSSMPKVYRTLTQTLDRLEKHFNDVQDVEFTIEDGNLYVLQTRNAKRTSAAALEHALQFVKEKRLTPEQALTRINYDQVKQLLHPTLKATDEKPFVRGLPASPGACSGRVAFHPETAVQMARADQKVILVRRETSPEDIMGMSVAEGILTSTGGMTSHAAVVGRGMGKCCVVGASDLSVDESARVAQANGQKISEGDLITLNGTTGEVYLGTLPTEPMSWGTSAQTFFAWADKVARVPVLANADTPDQAKLARALGARGIGLCRTEHMFFDRERIHKFRLMILSETESERDRVARELQSYQKEDFVGIFEAMQSLSVCVRLLDPPLHEFLPNIEDEPEIRSLADELQISESRLLQRIHQLHETNPMLGHRGCRLGITFPEIYEMQVRALAESLAETYSSGKKVLLKIMLPLVMNATELQYLLKRLKAAFDEALRIKLADEPKVLKAALKAVKWGTMIELPRACLVADEIGKLVDFISFGTNDLTQTGLGISRDDSNKFIPTYIEKGLLEVDPFESLDQRGIGKLIRLCVDMAREVNPEIEVGVCGEHGGEPKSIEFFASLNFNSVSCSPFRVPIARLATAKAEWAARGKSRARARGKSKR